jgi:hypothetical protein
MYYEKSYRTDLEKYVYSSLKCMFPLLFGIDACHRTAEGVTQSHGKHVRFDFGYLTMLHRYH